MSGKSEVGILEDAQKMRARVCAALEKGEKKAAQSALAELHEIAGTTVALSDRGRSVLNGHLTAAKAYFRRKTVGCRHCR